VALYKPGGIGGVALGFAVYCDVGGAGRRIRLVHLGKGVRTLANLKEFKQQLDRGHPYGVFDFHDLFTGMDAERLDWCLHELGFIPIRRMRLWLDPMRFAEKVPELGRKYLLRPMLRRDRNALVRLFTLAYDGHSDVVTESRLDARRQAQGFVHFILTRSRKAHLLDYASFVAEDRRPKAPVGAIMVTRASALTYVSDLMADPMHQRR
jgi:hypothetical protein